DSADRVYAFHRGSPPVLVFSPEGDLIESWGEGRFVDPHSIYIDAQDRVYLVDRGAHAIHRFGPNWELQLTIGTPGTASGKQSGDPFNLPACVAVAANGEILVADGYGNSRVHKYSPEGRLVRSWGSQGSGPGEFDLPHGIWVDAQQRVWVTEKQGHRLQRFTLDGEYIDTWTGFSKPNAVWVGQDGVSYFAEQNHRVSVLSPDGEVLSRWGEDHPEEPGQFIAPHGVWVDSQGDLYVAEVLQGKRLQKFTLKR
ncbi:MAG: peptidyl-alpha-hydroxyglycine alpha-amidating lyase family protein, partial [Chloroflexota bacterium]